MSEDFSVLHLKQELLENLKELNFNSMTPIQAKSLPVLLNGKDIIAQAKTGSGKTAAFGLNILNSLDVSGLQTQSLILCPTRELAEQVAKEIRMLARTFSNVKILTVCSGASETLQKRSLDHGIHIIVGTPGRVLRLLKKEVIQINSVKSFVLDEADRMLDMGFNEDIMKIASYLPEKRQSMLFSATYPVEIKNLGKSIQKNAVEIKVDVEHEPNSIDQIFFEVDGHQDKNDALFKILGKYKPERLIVFCKTKQITNNVANFLNKRGIVSDSINGDLEQNERTAVLTKFSNHSISVLVATDVASRGLDIQELPAIINYDLSSDPEVYVHRIGRTGRAGKTGKAFSLVVNSDKYKLEAIEEFTNKKCIVKSLSILSDAGESPSKYDLFPPMDTMYISGGKKDKLRPSDILGALVGEAKIDPKDVGDISILKTLSYVAIKNESIDQAIERLSSGKIKKRKFKVGLA